MKKIKKVFKVAVYGVVGAAVLALVLFFYFSSTLPTFEQITSRQVAQSTKIFDRTGKVLLYEISSGQERTVVPLTEIPQYLKDATIAIEDKRFYESPAFDAKAIARALWTNLKGGGNPLEGQGASTITQQLARNAFLTSERTIIRKIKELILAVRISGYYSKDKILELYLNEIPYGPIIYGVEAASETYFDKPVKELTLAESALLAALPKAPSYYSPWGSHLKELLSRQKSVLEKMFESGKITESDLKKAEKQTLVFQPQNQGLKAPHFTLAVRDYLVEKYGENLVGTGGLRVITTLDWELQQLAEKVVKEGAEENDRLYDGKNAALVAEDPKTGEILAMAGSRDYFATSSLPVGCTPGANCQFEPNFNVATQGLRQPGSALKPFVYLTAFEKGYTPETIVFDVPTEFAANNPNCPPVPDFNNQNNECFHPQNFDDQFRGPVQLKQALGQSINVPAVKVLYLAGLVDVVKKANSFGLETLTSPNLYGLSLVLGGGAVKLIDLVDAYSVLAEDGVKKDQATVLEVRDSNDNVLESYAPSEKRVEDPQPVRLVNNILSDIDIRRGLFQNSLGLTVFPEYDVALKTGTSNDYHDAWTIGYTPSIVVGVWAGNNNNAPMQRRGSSILAAVPIWSKFMNAAISKFPKETFPRPETIIPSKPIFAGDYTHDKQLHSILFYVDRKDPTGPPPQSPESDSQFLNWETGVDTWAKENIPDFANYNQPLSVNSSSVGVFSPPKIDIKMPTAGSFVGKDVKVLADISSPGIISQVNVYWNGIQLQGFSVNITGFYSFGWTLTPQISYQQNLLEIEAFDKNGASSKASVIVYKQP